MTKFSADFCAILLKNNITQEGTGESLSLLSFAEENGRISCSNKKWRVLYIVPAIFASFGTETNVLENGENDGNNEKYFSFSNNIEYFTLFCTTVEFLIMESYCIKSIHNKT